MSLQTTSYLLSFTTCFDFFEVLRKNYFLNILTTTIVKKMRIRVGYKIHASLETG